jgi:hypothetical protein
LAVLGLAVWAAAELFVLTEEDPVAEAAGYHNCEMYIKNGLNSDIKLVSKQPDSPDRWGTDNPPAVVNANSSASLDFKFRSSTKPSDAQMVYETVQPYGIPLQITMSWACKDVTLGTQAANHGSCTTNGGGNYVCEALETSPASASVNEGYRFSFYDQFPDPDQ